MYRECTKLKALGLYACSVMECGDLDCGKFCLFGAVFLSLRCSLGVLFGGLFEHSPTY